MKRLALDILRWHGLNRLPASGLLAKTARFYLASYDNENYNLVDNGESRLLERLVPIRPDMIFDVGANEGFWSRCARSLHPGATIHAFEIAAQTYDKLSAKVGSTVTAHQFGLSDQDGTVELEFFPQHDTISTVIKQSGIHDDASIMMDCPIRSGDSFCNEHDIKHIDLLKIDTEGAEHLVLKGFSRMLRESRISVIQFEYGMANIYTKFLLRDLYTLLDGFDIGKLYPHGVDFKAYHPSAENFRSPNFVAVLRARSDIRRALAGSV